MAAKTNPAPSVWTRPREPEQPALSRAAIVREAITMLDADGIEALSMRKLGAALNAGATSLYRHVATKDELMELAVDQVVAEITVPPASSPDWRAAAAETARSFRATALRHPWLASVLGQAGLAYLGPNLMSLSEQLAALFTTAGFPDPGGAIDVVLSYVIGCMCCERCGPIPRKEFPPEARTEMLVGSLAIVGVGALSLVGGVYLLTQWHH